MVYAINSSSEDQRTPITNARYPTQSNSRRGSASFSDAAVPSSSSSSHHKVHRPKHSKITLSSFFPQSDEPEMPLELRYTEHTRNRRRHLASPVASSSEASDSLQNVSDNVFNSQPFRLMDFQNPQNLKREKRESRREKSTSSDVSDFPNANVGRATALGDLQTPPQDTFDDTFFFSPRRTMIHL
eukprot:gb/GEZN01010216.1/.p1 GENE.gb/GEZN01010216.1/~~gb/GEZN01010216.1/.p1  ORF type:complete len:185 (+),score=2.80 gb/GEZN01010216.1/:578-1132(+)